MGALLAWLGTRTRRVCDDIIAKPKEGGEKVKFDRFKRPIDDTRDEDYR